MDDLEGYRQAQAAEWQQARHPFELEQLLVPFQQGQRAGQKPLAAAAGSCCCLVFLLLSVGTLTPLQYGLTMNLITRQIDPDNIYEGGRHFIGPWKSFVSFPSTRVTVSFANQKGTGSTQGPLETRTKDGLALTLQLAFQYRIDKNYLGKLFALANLNYEPLFVRNARDVLLKAAADYDAPQYWEEREKIGHEMQSLLNKRLRGVAWT
ncbi:vps18 [Symbiodinium natans]|uniref:Vps18 protein n=1 Tax=Symbiodinium natans TaxID=878477 RepID=A0A812QGH3_9DINO|nr:vps18 [Symbiodinium natans]